MGGALAIGGGWSQGGGGYQSANAALLPLAIEHWDACHGRSLLPSMINTDAPWFVECYQLLDDVRVEILLVST